MTGAEASPVREAWFIGCDGSVGHMMQHSIDGKRERSDGFSPPGFPWPHFDAGWDRPGRQGQTALHHKDGWTVLSVTDYTIDSRPGSHASFAFHADLTFDEALVSATAHFGDIVSRLNVTVGPLDVES